MRVIILKINHELKAAIELQHNVILTLDDGTTITGLPSWGTNRDTVKIKADEGLVWVPIEEIAHVTRIVNYTK